MKTDVVIIGAGIMGLCAALQISQRSRLSVTLLEQATALGAGSSGASSAVCRHRYTRDEMMLLARDGILAYRNWPAFTGLSRTRAEFHETGVAWFNPAGSDWAAGEAQRMQAMDISASVLDAESLIERFPAISPCMSPPDFETGQAPPYNPGDSFLFEHEAGYFDPVDALEDLAEAVRGCGVTLRTGSPVREVNLAGGRATGVTLESGERVDAGVVINANGPWCDRILAPLGLAARWPLTPVRIQMIHIDRPNEVRGDIPVCCDLVGGIYFREQNRGQQIVVGSTREEDERETVDPDNYADWVDDDFKATKLHALKHRIPSLPAHIRVSGYTGLYTVNTSDVHPLVGPSGIDGLYLANGFSGHGFKAAPAIGSLLARMITGVSGEFDTSVSLDFLSFTRDPLTVDAHNVMA